MPTFSPDPSTVWVFDLDNTLYPAHSNLFAKVSRRMTSFIMDRFTLGHDDARSLQRRLFREYGTTLRGLMDEHGVDPVVFLDHVHDIDLSDLAPAPDLDRAIAALPGRKLIYTNGSVPHAERITEKLGIAGHFEAVFDIVAADFVPKPDPRPYDVMLARHGVDPSRAVMIEDSAANLRPAADLGMTTVWLKSDIDWAKPKEGADDHIHHIVDDLAEWLDRLVA